MIPDYLLDQKFSGAGVGAPIRNTKKKIRFETRGAAFVVQSNSTQIDNGKWVTVGTVPADGVLDVTSAAEWLRIKATVAGAVRAFEPFADSPVSGVAVVAPATLDASNAAGYNGATLNLAAAATMTVSDAAWVLLPAGVAINVGQSGIATLAFSGTATKENASGTSAASVTLAASGVYALLPSPTGSPKFRLSGGASL